MLTECSAKSAMLTPWVPCEAQPESMTADIRTHSTLVILFIFSLNAVRFPIPSPGSFIYTYRYYHYNTTLRNCQYPEKISAAASGNFARKVLLYVKLRGENVLFKEIRLKFRTGNARIKAASKSYMGKETTK